MPRYAINWNAVVNTAKLLLGGLGAVLPYLVVKKMTDHHSPFFIYGVVSYFYTYGLILLLYSCECNSISIPDLCGCINTLNAQNSIFCDIIPLLFNQEQFRKHGRGCLLSWIVWWLCCANVVFIGLVCCGTEDKISYLTYGAMVTMGNFFWLIGIILIISSCVSWILYGIYCMLKELIMCKCYECINTWCSCMIPTIGALIIVAIWGSGCVWIPLIGETMMDHHPLHIYRFAKSAYFVCNILYFFSALPHIAIEPSKNHPLNCCISLDNGRYYTGCLRLSTNMDVSVNIITIMYTLIPTIIVFACTILSLILFYTHGASDETIYSIYGWMMYGSQLIWIVPLLGSFIGQRVCACMNFLKTFFCIKIETIDSPTSSHDNLIV